MSNLTEGVDYYLNENGLLVFTSSYHLKRKKCCGSGCLHCPYEYKNVETEKRKILLEERPPVILLSKNNK
jgi:hypothetical protein